ncbi:hypothetical protein HHX47_DHR1001634 [Lentinula edodes]|nr:hypothetical protein HHX47_DHR1001634 [Lentinula edodes]
MPPPDDPAYSGRSKTSATKGPSQSRPWFPHQQSSQGVSYQSGGIPTFNDSQAGGSGNSASEELESHNQWETRYGTRVDMLSAFAYILGPLSGAFRAYIDASQNGLSRFQLPIIGPIASQWLADE